MPQCMLSATALGPMLRLVAQNAQLCIINYIPSADACVHLAGLFNPLEHHSGSAQAGDQGSTLQSWPVLIGGRFTTVIDNGRQFSIAQPDDAVQATSAALTRKDSDKAEASLWREHASMTMKRPLQASASW